MDFIRLLIAALRLLLMRLPREPARAGGPGAYWLATALTGGVWALHGWFDTPAPRTFDPDAFSGLAVQVLWPLLLAYVVSRILRRDGIFWPLGTLLLLFAVIVDYAVYSGLAPLLGLWKPDLADGDDRLFDWIEAAWLALAAACALAWLDPFRPRRIRLPVALAAGLALVLPWQFLGASSFFYPSAWDELPAPEPARPALDAERVLSEQLPRVDAAVAALDPGTAGAADLWVVAFAGDGGEDVFRNEALYAERLFGERFAATGRTLVLVNHRDTVETRPLATRTNLRRALAGIGGRMEREHDILMLFLSTHGSDDHELAVSLDPLPLATIRPEDLSAALADAGIHWRVVVVSACYAGGFVPALQAPDALVLTAARADRTSFGCGVESEITYFGRAWLVEALNRTTSFTTAFEQARERIAAWERDEDKTPSEPQIATAPEIEAQLAHWAATLPDAEPVPFEAGETSPDREVVR